MSNADNSYFFNLPSPPFAEVTRQVKERDAILSFQMLACWLCEEEMLSDCFFGGVFLVDGKL
jgi:hypothetical protein